MAVLTTPKKLALLIRPTMRNDPLSEDDAFGLRSGFAYEGGALRG